MSPEMILTSPPLSEVTWHYLSQAILQPQLCQKIVLPLSPASTDRKNLQEFAVTPGCEIPKPAVHQPDNST